MISSELVQMKCPMAFLQETLRMRAEAILESKDV
jgi:hypothetical protein